MADEIDPDDLPPPEDSEFADFESEGPEDNEDVDAYADEIAEYVEAAGVEVYEPGTPA